MHVRYKIELFNIAYKLLCNFDGLHATYTYIIIYIPPDKQFTYLVNRNFRKWVGCEALAHIQDNDNCQNSHHNEPLSCMGAKAHSQHIS